jgi:predicted nucleotidyltransferase
MFTITHTDRTMRHLHLSLPSQAVGEVCQKHHIRTLSLFGSILREDFREATSDVDMLVEFEEGFTPGLRFFTIAAELSDCLGKNVDLCTKEDLNVMFRDEVLREALPVYEQGVVHEFD